MPRFQTDDTFGDSLPAKRAGTSALGLYYLCGLWSARYLTDGHVPAEVAAGYGTAEWARKLVDAGLFLVEDGGYLMPLFLNDNPSAEKVQKERQAKAERQAKWLEKHRNPSSKQRRVSSASSRPSNGTSRDASGDAAQPLPSPKGEGVDAAPRSEGAAPPTRQIKTTTGRLICEAHRLEVSDTVPCRGCAADAVAATTADDDLDQRPPVPIRQDPAPRINNPEDRADVIAARRVIDALEGREHWLKAARKRLAETGDERPSPHYVTIIAAHLYRAATGDYETEPPLDPKEE